MVNHHYFIFVGLEAMRLFTYQSALETYGERLTR